MARARMDERTSGSADRVAAAGGLGFLAPETRQPFLELLDRPLDALHLVLDHRVAGDPPDRRLDPLVDGALERLEATLRGGQQLVEEALAAVRVRGIGRLGARGAFFALRGHGAGNDLLHAATGLLADRADRLDALLDLGLQ